MALFTLAVLAVELALYAAATRSLLLALLVFVLVRAALAALLCALARSSPRVILGEAYALIVVYTAGLLLQRWLAPRDPARVVRGVTPVLFVHGIFCNAGVWHRQLAALRGTDNLFTVNLVPPLGSIDRFARQLADRVEEACRAAGTRQAIVVAHSMGGLAARAWIARLGGAPRVAALVTLGSPHHGSRLAPMAPGRCAAEMRHACGWLGELAAEEAKLASQVRVTSIYSTDDDFVVPQASARLEGARNVALAGLGHLELLASREVHRQVAAEIASARGERPS
jgi:pimeloyl-ACP methyl ester carboxylesterase